MPKRGGYQPYRKGRRNKPNTRAGRAMRKGKGRMMSVADARRAALKKRKRRPRY
jgi:hypothetical protein